MSVTEVVFDERWGGCPCCFQKGIQLVKMECRDFSSRRKANYTN